MKFSFEQKAVICAAIAFSVLLSVSLAGSDIRPPARNTSSGVNAPLTIPPEGTSERKGYTLFMQNCAHCHGDDARGDEGPDLHSLRKPDKRIVSIIKNGIKGEMPKFGAKFTDADVQALVAFVRSLN